MHRSDVEEADLPPTPLYPSRLVFSEARWGALLDHLARNLPNEGVALVATESGVDASWIATEVFPGTNMRSSPTRFEMDPREIIAALRSIDSAGWQLGAIVHTHPIGPPTPSRTDLAEAAYPESLMMIVSWASGAPLARAWRLEKDGEGWAPVEVPISIDPNG